MEYYSAIKNNEMMPSAAKWMNLECLILSEVKRRRNIVWHPLNVKSKKEGNELKNRSGHREWACGYQSQGGKDGDKG